MSDVVKMEENVSYCIVSKNPWDPHHELIGWKENRGCLATCSISTGGYATYEEARDVLNRKDQLLANSMETVRCQLATFASNEGRWKEKVLDVWGELCEGKKWGMRIVKLTKTVTIKEVVEYL